jgi:acyl-CoA thioesterase I
MSRTALFFASGESLYLGAALILLAVVSRALLKRSWVLRLCNVVALVGLALMVMACPPFALVVDLTFLAVFVLWFIPSNQPSASQTSRRLQIGSTLAVVILLLVFPAIEFSHRRMPAIPGSTSDHLVVIGDSISSGIDLHIDSWPLVLQKTCGIEVRNLARPGAQVSEGLLMAKDLTGDDQLVLIEIGGNDLLQGTSSDQFGRDLDALLSKVVAPNRTVLMFELPLLPNKISYGRIQRRLSAKYHVSLIPKRYFAQVISDANATTDGLHLSASGTRRMAFLVAQILSPVSKPCQLRSGLATDRLGVAKLNG